MKRHSRFDARQFVYYTMMWSRALVPVIAALTAFASAVRTYQTTKEIYLAGGTELTLAIIVSLAMTIGVEGTIFSLSLAQEWQEIKWRQARKRRRVFSVKTIQRFIGERLGRTEPLSYDQLPERGNLLSFVLFIAFGYALVSNFNIGVRPLIDKIGGDASFQTFLGTLANAQAAVQIQFVVDLVSILFPPFMAMIAGHLTARFASEIISTMNRSKVVRNTPPVPVSAPAERKSEPKRGASERVIVHLSEHPEDIHLSNRKLADKLEVSVGTVNGVLQTIRSGERSGEQPNEHPMNGNGRSR